MLGDIVTKPINDVQKQGSNPTAAGPVPRSAGYGSAGFGVTSTPQANSTTAAVTTRIAADDEPVQPIRQAGSGRVPLVLTVIGVLVFVSGVSGLFMYALSGS